MEVKTSFPIEWRCPSCRFEQWVRVKARGSGSWAIGDRDDSVTGQLSEMSAQQNAWRAAKMKLALRPCPKCGAIDRKRVVWTVVRAFVISTLSAALAAGIVVVQLLHDSSAAMMSKAPVLFAFAALVCPVIGAGITVFLWFARWRLGGRDVVAVE